MIWFLVIVGFGGFGWWIWHLSRSVHCLSDALAAQQKRTRGLNRRIDLVSRRQLGRSKGNP